MNGEVAALLELQSGVVSRRQLLAAGVQPHDIRRMARRCELSSVHAGVYIDHTGELTWLQRAWAGVLYAWPAALSHQSAIRAADGPGRIASGPGPIHVAVARNRDVTSPDGVVIHQLAGLDHKSLWNMGPPRIRVEEALVDVAAESSHEFDAIALLANAIQARRTTAARIRDALEGRTRIARREFLVGVLTDLAEGTCSVLEHGYLNRIERPHGLPRGRRQAPAWSSGRIYEDVRYDGYDVIVELDGRLFHDNATARDRDLDRDLEAFIGGRITPRIGWGQVFVRPCLTAKRIGALLAQRGWTGELRSCPNCDLG